MGQFSRFGEIISKDKVMLCFVKDGKELSVELIEVLEEKRIEVVKIEIEKNVELCDALNVKEPEFMFYQNGQRYLRYKSPVEDLVNHLKTFKE
jgi:hypothetical protein